MGALRRFTKYAQQLQTDTGAIEAAYIMTASRLLPWRCLLLITLLSEHIEGRYHFFL